MICAVVPKEKWGESKIKILNEDFEAKDPTQIWSRSSCVSLDQACVSILCLWTLDGARPVVRKEVNGVQGTHFSSCLIVGEWEEALQWRKWILKDQVEISYNFHVPFSVIVARI